MNEDYLRIIEQRAREVQPHIHLLVQDFKSMGMSQEEIILEISFALMHEGYRLCELKDGVKINAWQRTLQTKVPTENNE